MGRGLPSCSGACRMGSPHGTALAARPRIAIDLDCDEKGGNAMKRVYLSLVGAMALGFLGACTKAEPPSEVSQDVGKARQEAARDVADARQDAANKVQREANK